MIRLVRIDHRLLHGQVAYSWVKAVGVNAILIANDAVAQDTLRMSALRLAKPEHVKLVIKSLVDSAAAIESGVTDSYELLILVESIADACWLVKRLAASPYALREINVGGVRAEEGKCQISSAIFVSPEEEQLLRETAAQGVNFLVQMLSTDTARNVIDLL
ncbi:PTS sugar transporter subunit IIB [Collinsella sp. zg1085]|uniref:PTS sugar transporter subunit IIB n=1 Tax=Collinsella sp. zg1085 TaxID=2844380 RepID=UPI001C0D2115|nr:PTS sugar transporter subunit IIB [Collinsella sp. zg1085]QWT17558.1 PTS sugar transporter subunit IIB [Collinsella sp. zg1085]